MLDKVIFIYQGKKKIQLWSNPIQPTQKYIHGNSRTPVPPLSVTRAMNSAPSKLYTGKSSSASLLLSIHLSLIPLPLYKTINDVSLVVVLLNTKPFFWAAAAGNTFPHHPAATLPFAKFLNHVIPFLDCVLLLNQLNQVVLIAIGVNSSGYIYDSAGGGSHGGNMPAVCSKILHKLEEFVAKDRWCCC